MNQQSEFKAINDIREEAIVTHFRKNKDKKVFILTESFPFMFIGKIKEVLDDTAVLDVQTTSVPALEGKEWILHIDAIEVFYIETGIGPKIPDLKD
ncbi:hypothetical protein [Cytobacillus dafuensis]|uniref:DUF2642 domain-containing protein n=1 Tax=Cytobacillus dafuensis TaxID=1742359 RepID=A0A5B8YZP6_CYTDA|nr:hypothetical protein [Cytobacillus dafuensis]QED46202.1 hypothetical protein FSZ17_02290 [Cytobacillus dafuensis]